MSNAPERFWRLIHKEINVNQDEFDEDHLRQAAKEALGFNGPTDLDGPSNGHMNMPEGFGVVYSYPPQAGDLVDESNYYATLAAVKEAAGEKFVDRDIKESSVGHWTYSYFDVLLVRVYEPGTEPWLEGKDPRIEVEYTDAFLAAVDCADRRHQYPLLDETDYNEREYAAWEKEVDEAIAQEQRRGDYGDDEDDVQAIRDVMSDLLDEEGESAADAFGGPDGYSPDNVDYEKVAEWYGKAREEMFARQVAAYWGDPIELHRDTPGSGTILMADPNQLPLFE